MDWEFGVSRYKLFYREKGPIVPHRELYPLSCNKPYGKEKKFFKLKKKMLLLC